MKRALAAVLLAAAAVTLAGCAAAARVVQIRANHLRPVVSRTIVDCYDCDPPVYRSDWRTGELRLGRPDPKVAHLVTRAQIHARNAGNGVTVAAVLVTYGEAKSLAPDLAGASSAVVDPSRKVWLVTDYYDPPRHELRDGGWGPPANSGLSAKFKSIHDSFVLDAATDTETDACRGCAAVPESNTSWPAARPPTVTRAQVLTGARQGFGTRDVRVELVWHEEGVGSVDLEWRTYASHAHMTLHSYGPKGDAMYRGPAVSWLGAMGAPPAGFASIRPLRGHHVLPLRSGYIPVSTVRSLGKHGSRIALTPVRVRPTIGRFRALATAGGAERARHIWLVDLFETERVRLAWLVARRDGSYAFVDAVSGKRI